MYLVPVALSLHQEDGTMPRVIVASLPDLSQDQEGENFTCSALNALNFPELTSRPRIGRNAFIAFTQFTYIHYLK